MIQKMVFLIQIKVIDIQKHKKYYPILYYKLFLFITIVYCFKILVKSEFEILILPL